MEFLSIVTRKKRSMKTNNMSSITNKGVTVLGDHIWFYGPIDEESALELNREMQDMSMKMAPTAFSSMQEVASPAPIWLHINSPGGDVFSSFAMADTIERIAQVVPVITIVEGCAASGATLVSMAGTKRLIRKNAFMLIHELSTVMWGKHTDLKDGVANNETIMRNIKEYYIANSKIPKEKIEDILKKDIWWNAKTCLKYGLVDQII